MTSSDELKFMIKLKFDINSCAFSADVIYESDAPPAPHRALHDAIVARVKDIIQPSSPRAKLLQVYVQQLSTSGEVVYSEVVVVDAQSMDA